MSIAPDAFDQYATETVNINNLGISIEKKTEMQRPAKQQSPPTSLYK